MAGSPKWKVFVDDEYIASCKYAEDAAALVGARGPCDDGSVQVRYGHSKRYTVWRDGLEDIEAAESYDVAAETMIEREAAQRAKDFAAAIQARS